MTTATVPRPQQKREELTAQLEQGVAALRESDEYRHWLDTAARFHQYSWGNQLLISIQRPDASRVAGYRAWQGMGRQVCNGQKGIRILAPTFFRKGCNCGDACECRANEAVRFRSVSVFDIEQTDGAALPEIVTLLAGDGLGLPQRLEALADAEGLTVDRDPANARNGANGWYSRDRALIWVRPDVDDAQAAKTLAHELGHHFAEHRVNGHCREEGEIIAESVAYIVLRHFGLDAGGYTFGYLASWDTDDDKHFKAQLAEIQHTAATIIDRLEECQR